MALEKKISAAVYASGPGEDGWIEDHSGNVQPGRVQPVVQQLAQNEAQQNSAGNDKTDLRVAGDDAPGIAIVSIRPLAHRERLAEIG